MVPPEASLDQRITPWVGRGRSKFSADDPVRSAKEALRTCCQDSAITACRYSSFDFLPLNAIGTYPNSLGEDICWHGADTCGLAVELITNFAIVSGIVILSPPSVPSCNLFAIFLGRVGHVSA